MIKASRAETRVLIRVIPRPRFLALFITTTTLQYCRPPDAAKTAKRKEIRDKSGTILLGSLPAIPVPLLNTASGSGLEVSLAHRPTPRDETGHELAVAAVWNAEALPQLAFF